MAEPKRENGEDAQAVDALWRIVGNTTYYCPVSDRAKAVFSHYGSHGKNSNAYGFYNGSPDAERYVPYEIKKHPEWVVVPGEIADVD